MITPEEIQDIDSWITNLGTMYENHSPELDHKDCKEIGELMLLLKTRLIKMENEVSELRKENPFEHDDDFYYGYITACNKLEKKRKEMGK